MTLHALHMNCYSITYAQDASPGLPPVGEAHLVALTKIDGETHDEFWVKPPAGKKHLPSHAVLTVKRSAVRSLAVSSTLQDALRASR